MVNPFVLLPLYWYPLAGSWDAVFTHVAANPSVSFSLIINPNSGPAGSTPDAAYASVVSKLNGYNNTQLLGYVRTDWTKRPADEVTSEIDQYAAWANVKTADYHIDGIFFDEAPSESSGLSYMTDVTTHAKSALRTGVMASKNPYVMFNPGTAVPDGYYSIADNIVAAELDYGVYSSKDIAKIKESTREKSSVILYNFKGTAEQQKAVAKEIVQANIPGVSVTNVNGYTELSGILPDLVAAVKGLGTAVGGGDTAPPPAATTTTAPGEVATPVSSAAPSATTTKAAQCPSGRRGRACRAAEAKGRVAASA